MQHGGKSCLYHQSRCKGQVAVPFTTASSGLCRPVGTSLRTCQDGVFRAFDVCQGLPGRCCPVRFPTWVMGDFCLRRSCTSCVTMLKRVFSMMGLLADSTSFSSATVLPKALGYCSRHNSTIVGNKLCRSVLAILHLVHGQSNHVSHPEPQPGRCWTTGLIRDGWVG